MQIHRVFVSFRRTISSKTTRVHRIRFVRNFSIQENPESHNKQLLHTTVLPIHLRMEMADKQAQELSEYIRATHGKLRNEYRKIKDPDIVWSVHINKKEELQHYAAAMHKLAEIWEAKVEDKDYVSRISWCYQALQNYFRKGELEKTRVKEQRTVSFHLPHLLALPKSSNGAAIDTAGVESTIAAASKVVEVSSVMEELMTTGISVCVSGTAASIESPTKAAAATETEDMSTADGVANTPTGASIETASFSKTSSFKEVDEVSNDLISSNTLELSNIYNPKDNEETVKTRSVASDPTNYCDGGDRSSSQGMDCATKESSVPSKESGTVDQSWSSGRELIVYGDRLRVLDVGSCYNPFSRYPDLDVTALDLQPATEDVYQCDFLKLNISDSGSSFLSASPVSLADQSNDVGSGDEGTTATTSNIIRSLPANSFDAILFSYLLSYIPSPELRLRCCKNAYHLLKPEGALVIAAADSRGLIGNGYVYKCWQITMASLGFVRVKYEKFKDFHGMVFRKGIYPEVCNIDANRKLEFMKTKKSEMETDFVNVKENGIRYSKRRVRQIESFDLDNAFLGLWLPHDFKDSNEEEHVIKSIKDADLKRKREASADFPEETYDAAEPLSKASKKV